MVSIISWFYLFMGSPHCFAYFSSRSFDFVEYVGMRFWVFFSMVDNILSKYFDWFTVLMMSSIDLIFLVRSMWWNQTINHYNISRSRSICCICQTKICWYKFLLYRALHCYSYGTCTTSNCITCTEIWTLLIWDFSIFWFVHHCYKYHIKKWFLTQLGQV